jgi:phage-related protein
MKIIFYKTKASKAPVDEFIQKLSIADRAKILSCLLSIEELGLDPPRVQFRQIKGKLWEIKIRSTDGSYRMFYITLKNTAMI